MGSTCSFEGDDNLYGLGVRIGSYLQWLTVGLAYNFAPKKTVGLVKNVLAFVLTNML